MTVSRRRLLQGAAVAAAGLAGCGENAPQQSTSADVDARHLREPPPTAPPMNCKLLSFFDAGQAATITAIAARLIPGDEEDPGAEQACVVHYIDQKLGTHHGWAEPTYTHGPYAHPVVGNPGPQQDSHRNAINVDHLDLPRYGYQGRLGPQELYAEGLTALHKYTLARFHAAFTELSHSNQDKVLAALEAGNAQTFEDPSSDTFFGVVQQDVVEGWLADPIYGGNREMVGWKHIGFPGVQRYWTPQELTRGPRNRTYQSLAQMPAMHPGHDQPHVILPISGSRR